MVRDLFITVVIPCFDEMANLQKGVLDKVQHFLERKNWKYEVLIVDDGSKDGSLEFLKEYTDDNPCFKLIQNPHLGKAGAVTTGMLKGEGEYILFTDMDQATPIEELKKIMPFFDEGFDIVIGSRADRRKGAPWTRRIVSKANIILRKLIVGLPDISDTQCGFKAFRYDTAKHVFQSVSELHGGFKKIKGSNVTAGFDVELLFLAQKMGYKIKEVPVNWLHVESRRVNVARDAMRGLSELFLIRQNNIEGVYNQV